MTTRQVRRTHQAESDLRSAGAYYGEESLDLELRFLSAVERECGELLLHPEIGAARPRPHLGLDDLRVWRVAEFPYWLYYRPIASRSHPS